MKKFIAVMVCLVLVLGLVGCGTATNKQSEINIAELKQGDEVSIVGQVAGSKLVNGHILWVQVKQSDDTFVIYHCQLKDEYIEKGENLKTLDVVKVKGIFLSLMDLEMENTAPVITLYDCEIK